MNIVEKARATALEAHEGQVRKYTSLPYFTHVEEVAKSVEFHGGTAEQVAAAYLHDIVEDTHWSHPLVYQEFGKTVSDYVVYLTDVSNGLKLSRAERKKRDREFIASAPPEVKTIKLADLKSNLKDIVKNDRDFARVYFKEKVLLLGVLTEGNRFLYMDVLEILSRDWSLVFSD